MKSHGVVLTRKFQLDHDGNVTKWFPIDPDVLSYYALYFDAIDLTAGFVGDNLNSKDVLKDLDLLRQENMLNSTLGRIVLRGDRSKSAVRSNIIITSTMALTTEVWRQRTERDQGWRWSIAHSDNNSLVNHVLDSVPTKYTVHSMTPFERGISVFGNGSTVEELPYAPGAAIELTFDDILIRPAPETPLIEILEFRLKRKAELESFRFQLDEIYQRIISSGDATHALEHEKDRLTRTLNNINKASVEHFKSTVLSGIQVSLDGESLAQIPSKVREGAAMGLALGAMSGEPLYIQLGVAVGGILGAARAIIKINPALWWKPKDIPKEHSDFAYLYEAGRKFGKG